MLLCLGPRRKRSKIAALSGLRVGRPVPAAALQRIEDEWVVFVPQSQERFEIRRVGRGRDLGGEVELLSGVKPGETVVVDGAFLLVLYTEVLQTVPGGEFCP